MNLGRGCISAHDKSVQKAVAAKIESLMRAEGLSEEMRNKRKMLNG